MLAYLKGKITEMYEDSVVLEAGHIGYEIFMASPESSLEIEQQTKLYIYESIKEDSHDLYGFCTRSQKSLFKQLVSVSGIGPKSGMQVLMMYTPEEVVEIISSEDTKALSKVSGIGPKTAQRIILELKDKISKIYAQIDDILPILQTPTAKDNQKEAIEALVALGYNKQDSTKAVEAIYIVGETTEDMIKKALVLLM